MLTPFNQNNLLASTDLEETSSSDIELDESLGFKHTLNSTKLTHSLFNESSVGINHNNFNTVPMLITHNSIPIDNEEDSISTSNCCNEVSEWNRFNPFKIFTKSKREEDLKGKKESSLRLRKRDVLLSTLKTQQKFFENDKTIENNNEGYEGEDSEINARKQKESEESTNIANCSESECGFSDDFEEQKMKTALSNRAKERIINIKDIFPLHPKIESVKVNKKVVKLSLDNSQLSKTKFIRELIPCIKQNTVKKNELEKNKKLDAITNKDGEAKSKESSSDYSALSKDQNNKNLKNLNFNSINPNKITALKVESKTNPNLEQLSGETLHSALCTKNLSELSDSHTETPPTKADKSKVKESKQKKKEIALRILVNLSEEDCDFLQTFTGIILDENFRNKPKLLLSAYLTVIYEAKAAGLKKDKEIKDLKDDLEALNKEKLSSNELNEAAVHQFKKELTELKTYSDKQNSEIKTLMEKFEYSSNVLRNEYDVISKLYRKIKELKQQHLDFHLIRQYFNDYIVAYSHLVTSLITHTFESRNSSIQETLYLKESQQVQEMLNLLSKQHFSYGFFKKKKNVDTQRNINTSYFVEINSIMGKFLNSIYQA